MKNFYKNFLPSRYAIIGAGLCGGTSYYSNLWMGLICASLSAAMVNKEDKEDMFLGGATGSVIADISPLFEGHPLLLSAAAVTAALFKDEAAGVVLEFLEG